MNKHQFNFLTAGLARPAAYGLIAAAALGLTGSIDDKYDLTDSDST